MAIPNKKLPYLNDNNAVNLTTAQPTSDNKVYIIDQRLLNELLKKVTVGSLRDIKDDIISRVNLAEDKENLFKELDDYIYLNHIINLIPKEEVECTSAVPDPVIIEQQY